jgi:exopolyphosphatase/guanosine-5'-triphosphate,3'-diphosphate pyrophosphatase
MELYGVREVHANQVSTLSAFLFDQLTSLHLLGDEERKLLRVASLLHDIGTSISYYKHYLHSFYIILNARLNGLTHRETLLIAAVAASHGKEKLKTNWNITYKDIINQKDYKIFQKLSLLLKLAECLDRSEIGIVKNLDCKITDDIVRIKTYKSQDAELEINLANENSESFRKIFGRGLIIT